MTIGQSERYKSGLYGLDAGAAGPRGSAPEVVVCLPDVAHRSRVVGALQRAGYRVAVPRQPVAWVTARRSPVLVTDDTEGDAAVRAEVLATAPATACVVLIHEPTPARYRRLLASGATALPVGAPDEDVVLAVGAASRALTCLPASAARALAGFDGDRPVLTQREASWLRALVDGATVAGLARSVGYSPREMYRVLGGLYARLGAANRTDALLRADRWGLLGPPVAAPPEATRRARVPAQRGPARRPAGPVTPDGRPARG